ncbi:MAG: AAA family ATPase [Sandaracinaceae bacterium]
MPQTHLQPQRDQILRDVLEHVHAREPLLVLEAPPGSGKTHVSLRAAVLAAHHGERVAVVTQTNAQADDFCRRMGREYPRIGVYRFLAREADDIDLGSSCALVRRERDLPVGPCIVVATGAKWATLREDADFDLTLVDEAWQMRWADFMFLSRVAPRFVLIGDPGQIDPTVTVDVRRWETARRPPHRAAPDLILADPSSGAVRRQLPVSTRLPHDTVELVRGFYDFPFDSWASPGERHLVLPGASKADPIDRALERLRAGSLSLLTLPTPDDGPPQDEDLELAETVAKTVRRLLARDARARTEDGEAPLTPSDIGVTATHRVMNARLVEALGELASHVRVDTPERWQGLERKVMLAVHPLSGVTDPSAFDLSTGRLCVMTSRHRVGLVVVSRDHVGDTLEGYLPVADQAVSRPDVTGRGHAQHLAAWRRLAG